MARATFVKSARKAVPSHGIEVGDSYYWWKFRHGGKHYSKTAPKASQLTQSSYLSTLYDIQERIADLPASSDAKDIVEQIVSDLNDLADECESNRDNMPESLQDGSTGELLQNRAETCRSAADEIDGIDMSDFEPEESDCALCGGSGGDPEGEGDCAHCNGTGKVPHDDEHADGSPVNSEGDTEEEYWQAKVEEVQGVSLDAE